MLPAARLFRFAGAVLGILVPTCGAHAGFTDATSGSGLWGGSPTWGASAIDIDQDGDFDLVNHHHFYSVFIFTNDGAGSFTTFGIPQIVGDIQDRHGFLWVDLDGDEILDALCSHGGDGGCACPDDGNELWQGLGSGNFDLVPNAGGMFDAEDRGRSFSAADVDGDGDLDLHHSVAPLVGYPNRLYRNDGSMSFVDVAPAWGLDEEDGTVGGLFADFDDDGDPDLLVGGEEFSRTTVLWRNDGGTFTDVTAVALGSLPSIAGADWGDFDNDLDLDLAICEGDEGVYDAWGLDGNDFWFFANHRFNDDGVDVFHCESLGGNPVAIFQWRGSYQPDKIFLGPSGQHPTQPVITLTDAYVGAPTFTPGVDEGLYVWRETPGGTWQIHASAPPGSFGNFSGWLYTLGGIANPGDSNLEQLTVPVAPPRVFRNDGGIFTEVTGSLGLTPSSNPRSVAWVDFDNDGDLDLHLTNKGAVDIGNEPDVLWRNDGAQFSALGGAGWIPGDADHLTDGGVWSDLDSDGDLDLFLQEGSGPFFFAEQSPSTFYRNDGPAGHWLSVELGTTSGGGTSVGAKVTCHAGALTVHRRVEANTWRGFQEPSTLHFGLGAETLVDSLVIEWPNSGVQVAGPFSVDQAIQISEGPPVGAPVVADRVGHATVGLVIPQPSRRGQEIELVLPAPVHLRVRVYDVAGRPVRTLADHSSPAGVVRLVWDGRDERGRLVPAGIYFVRGIGDTPFSRKAVRLR